MEKTGMAARMEDYGVSPRTVMRFLDEAKGMESLYSFTVVKDDKVLLDEYFPPFHRELYRDLYSVSKSIISLAVGVACGQGKLSLDAHLTDFFEEDMPGQFDARVKKITVRNMLTMSSSSAYTSNTFRGKQENWRTLYLGLPLPDEPGRAFHYDTGAPYMLGCIVSKVMGIPCREVLERYIFSPMGITGCVWSEDPDHNITGGWDCFMRAKDYVKLGKLILNYGNWDGVQLISREYMEEATSELICTLHDPGVGWCYGYGFLFWRWPDDTFGCFGAFGQLIVCSPKKNMYVATTAGLPVSGNQRLALLIIETLIGEAQQGPVEREDGAGKELKDLLDGWELPCPDGESALPGLEKDVFGRAFCFPENGSLLESACFGRRDEKTIRMKFGYGGKIVEADARWQGWIAGKADFGGGILDDQAFSYAWSGEDTLTVKHILLNTAYVKEYRFTFQDGKVVCEARQNVVIPGAGSGVKFQSL